jgi:hypothetical protein
VDWILTDLSSHCQIPFPKKLTDQWKMAV